MKQILILTIASILLSLNSCNWAKEKTTNVIKKTGSAIGKTGSEFSNSVYNGVKNNLENDIIISDRLKKAGLQVEEVTLNSTYSTSNNILTAYIIFNEKFDDLVRVQVYNEEGKEYGRATENINGEKGDAKYIDFNFDKRVNFGIKGKITFEYIKQ